MQVSTRWPTWKCCADELHHVAEALGFHPSLEGYLNDTKSLLELHKASKVSISEDESILDFRGSWSGCLLKEQLRSGGLQGTPLFREVNNLVINIYTVLHYCYHVWELAIQQILMRYCVFSFFKNRYCVFSGGTCSGISFLHHIGSSWPQEEHRKLQYHRRKDAKNIIHVSYLSFQKVQFYFIKPF